MRAALIALCASLALAGCKAEAPAAEATTAAAPADAAAIKPALEAAMADSVAGWNEGDVAKFMALYSDDPQASFIGSGGLQRGKAAMTETYRKAYDFDDIAKRGTLAIETLDVRPLGPDHALFIGRFTLTYADTSKEPATGLTSLVFAREDGGWKVISDHSS